MTALATPVTVERGDALPQRSMRSVASVEQPNGFDRDYWLRNCEGYRVDAAEGRLGFVDSIRAEANGELLLAVRAGLLGRRLMLFRARDVAFIVPRAGRIWLATPAQIVGSESG